MQTATNSVTSSVPAGVPTAEPATSTADTGAVFAQLLAALSHQFADKGAPELLSADKLSNPDSTPAANANPAAAGTLGVNLRALLAALHGAATKPTNSPADVTKVLDKSGADDEEAATETKPAPTATPEAPLPADPSAQLTQLLAVVPQAQPTRTVAVAQSSSSDTLAAADAPIEEVATAIIANGNAAKPSREPTSKALNAAADNAKSQAQTSTATTLAALATANERNVIDPPASAPQSVHGNTTPALDNPAPENGSRGQSDNAHGHNPQAANDARPETLSVPAPQAAVAAANLSGHAPTPIGDGATFTVAGSVPAKVPAEHVSPSAVHAELQLTHAGPTPDTGALAVTIAARSLAGARHFDIRLDPPELGRVDVHLMVDDGGKTLATLTVEKPQTLELLQKDSSNLERALKDAGLDLSQNGLNFSLKGQQHHDNEHSPATRSRALSARAIAPDEIPTTTHSLSGVGASQTRLDIRV